MAWFCENIQERDYINGTTLMPGMSQVIYEHGVAEGISQGIQQGQNVLIETIQRLKNGESREDIIASGIDEHTVDLAISIR